MKSKNRSFFTKFESEEMIRPDGSPVAPPPIPVGLALTVLQRDARNPASVQPIIDSYFTQQVPRLPPP